MSFIPDEQHFIRLLEDIRQEYKRREKYYELLDFLKRHANVLTSETLQRALNVESREVELWPDGSSSTKEADNSLLRSLVRAELAHRDRDPRWAQSSESSRADYLAKQIAAKNSAVDDANAAAARLGQLVANAITQQLVNSGEATPVPDEKLLVLVKNVYDHDAKFQAAWNAVKLEPPSPNHSRWVRLWLPRTHRV